MHGLLVQEGCRSSSHDCCIPGSINVERKEGSFSFSQKLLVKIGHFVLLVRKTGRTGKQPVLSVRVAIEGGERAL